MNNDHKHKPLRNDVQTHVHEFAGSTKLATIFKKKNQPVFDLLHNHRFAGVTSQVQPMPTQDNPDDHTHTILVKTDFFLNHFHEISLQTGPVIPIVDPNTSKVVGHVHAIVGTSSRVFSHEHDFKSNTVIQNPINGRFTSMNTPSNTEDKPKKKC